MSGSNSMQSNTKKDINYLSLFTITDETSNSGTSANPESVLLTTKLASCIKSIITNKYWYYDGEWEGNNKEEIKKEISKGLTETSQNN